MLRLALRYQEQIRYFPMPDRDVQVGAAVENDLVAPFPGISRHHAKLHPEGDSVRVTDLGSTNGLVRDGRRLDEILLTPGKAVCLGHAILTLEDLSSSDGETGLRFQVSDGQDLGEPPGDRYVDVAARRRFLSRGGSALRSRARTRRRHGSGGAARSRPAVPRSREPPDPCNRDPRRSGGDRVCGAVAVRI